MEWGNNNSASLKCMSEAEELHLQLKVKIHSSNSMSPWTYPFGTIWAQKWKWAHCIVVRISFCQSLQPSSIPMGPTHMLSYLFFNHPTLEINALHCFYDIFF